MVCVEAWKMYRLIHDVKKLQAVEDLITVQDAKINELENLLKHKDVIISMQESGIKYRDNILSDYKKQVKKERRQKIYILLGAVLVIILI